MDFLSDVKVKNSPIVTDETVENLVKVFISTNSYSKEEIDTMLGDIETVLSSLVDIEEEV